MAEYIEREALIKRLLSISVIADDMYGMGINRGLERAETQIEMMPAADVVPKSEVAREIFEEIETCMKNFEDDDDGYLLKMCEFEFFMRELKKKYTENIE